MVIKFLVVPDKRLKGKERLGKDFKARFVFFLSCMFTRYVFEMSGQGELLASPLPRYTSSFDLRPFAMASEERK